MASAAIDAPGAVVGGDWTFAAVVDVEAGVFPQEEVGEFSGADEFGIAQGVEAVAEVMNFWQRARS